MAFIVGIVDVQDSDGDTIVTSTDGTRPALVLKMGLGVSASFAKDGDQGVVTLVANANGNTLPVLTGIVSFFGPNSQGAASGFVVVQPSTDFPGATSIIFKATLWAGLGSAPPSPWTASHSYSSGDLVQNATGAGGQPVVYVCTTGGTSSGSHGPTGFGTGLQDQGASACRWRSATAGIVVLINGSPFAAPTTTSYTAPGAPNAAALEVSINITSGLLSASSRTAVSFLLEGDPSDGSTATAAVSGGARLVFS